MSAKQDEIVTLLPCPFCGAPVDDFAGMIPEAFARCIENGTFAMGCRACDTTGPMKPSMEEAIAAWNTRSTAQEPALDDDALIQRLKDMRDYCLSELPRPHANNVAQLCSAVLNRLQAKAPETDR